MCGELLIFHRNQQFATHTYIRVPVAKTVTRRHLATAVIEELGKEAAPSVFSRDSDCAAPRVDAYTRYGTAGGTTDEATKRIDGRLAASQIASAPLAAGCVLQYRPCTDCMLC